MSIEITMPRLSDTMESGTILKWNVKEGDAVSAGDVIADVETDKATMEMQAYDDGTIAKLVVGEGETVDTGTVIAILAEESEDVEEAASTASSKREGKKKQADGEDEDKDDGGGTATATKEKDEKKDDDDNDDAEEKDQRESEDEKDEGRKKRDEQSEDDGSREAASGEADDEGLSERARSEMKPGSIGNGRVKVSPVARRIADDHGIDVKNIQGSGPGGRIIKRDVEHAIEAGEETKSSIAPAAKRSERSMVPTTPVTIPTEHEEQRPLEERAIKLSNMRQTIAKRLIESKTTIPHYQVTLVFNMDPLLELRKTLNAQLQPQGVKLSVNDFLVRTCAIAMHRHHEFNASWEGDHIKVHGEANIGIAISLPASRGGGLTVATIRNADQKGLRVISKESKELAEKARTKGLSQEELSGSTFTISNLGMYGVEHFTAIINPPNSAIMAVGSAVQKPVVRNGEIVIGHEMQATVSCDHRVIDGAMAAEYMQTVKQLIENPASLLV
jgi:pyruvate dehydrogenase E2 component (dihydrolipoamide acetyltransferase)